MKDRSRRLTWIGAAAGVVGALLVEGVDSEIQDVIHAFTWQDSAKLLLVGGTGLTFSLLLARRQSVTSWWIRPVDVARFSTVAFWFGITAAAFRYTLGILGVMDPSAGAVIFHGSVGIIGLGGVLLAKLTPK